MYRPPNAIQKGTGKSPVPFFVLLTLAPFGGAAVSQASLAERRTILSGALPILRWP